MAGWAAGPATLKPAGSAMPPSRVSNGYALRTRSTQICQGPRLFVDQAKSFIRMGDAKIPKL